MEHSGDPRWITTETDETLVAHLAAATGLDPVIARLLVNRGVATAEEAAKFLSPDLGDLHDPSLLPDLDVGVERVAAAIGNRERICVHGDYDVDGVTSTALLVRTLAALGAEVEYVVPHRHRDGYGIKPPAVEAIKKMGCGLVVTCDCGITACDTVDLANELGLDVIITDHHEPGAALPRALAVVDPKRHDAHYPFPDLAGVGVAFKFAQGLVRRLGHNPDTFVERFVDLAALGTVADVVPLVGENRAIVKHGLNAIPASKKLGFQAMLQALNFAGREVTAYDLAFVLAPRINAVGRMDDAATALRLFLTKDSAEARSLAAEMERHNSDRRAVQEAILVEALEQAGCKVAEGARVLVLAGEGWNAGVIGIVAGRICETFGRPTIMLCKDPETGVAGGSARSCLPFNVVDALRACGDLLLTCGGHALAAGLSLSLENLSALEERLNEIAAAVITDEDMLPRIEAEAELDLRQINRRLADAIRSLEPFGEANPEPLFVSRGVTVLSRSRVGDGSHLRLSVQHKSGAPIGCIAFKLGDWADRLELGGAVDLCYNIRLNSFNGTESVQLAVKAIRA